MARSRGQTVVTKEQRRLAHEKYLEHTQEVLETLLEILRDTKADSGHRLAAAKEINNRAYGQAPSHATMMIEHNKSAQPVFSDEALRALTQEQLEQYAELTRAILTAADPVEATAAEIEDDT